MRSNYLTDFRNQLADLNNCFSHYIFVWEQFYIDNNEIITLNNSSLTTKIYPTNPNSRQFNVKLQHLSNSHEETYNLMLKSLFLLMYSQFEVYIRSFYEFARKSNETLPNLTVNERVPDDIFNHLNIIVSNNFDVKESLTFDYLRLRRNRIVHSGGQSKGEVADLIRQKGNSIQQFWTYKLTNGLFGINFQSHEIDNFTKEEIFDVINIWRILTSKIDKIICDKIGRHSILMSLKSEFESKNKIEIKSKSINRIRSKFNSYCKINFNIALSTEELKNIVINGVVA
jgi:hypothetical protein